MKVPKTYRELCEYKCPICNGEHMLTEKRGDYRVAVECECKQLWINSVNIKRSGLSETIDELTFDNFKTTEDWQEGIKNKAVEYTKRLLGGGNEWCMICGSVGAGKTHLGTAIMRNVLFSGIRATYREWRELARQLKTNQLDVEEYDRILRELNGYKVLYIDDFLKGSVTEADINVAYDLINERYKRNLPTIITGEKTHDEVEKIDMAIASRIYQKSKNAYIEIARDAKKDQRHKNN